MVKLLKARAKSLPEAEYMEVTPDMASEWLDTGGRNRKLNPRRVSMYAAAMKRGDWMVTSQGIAFNQQGELSDGQHRLAAIVEADTPVTLLVVKDTQARSQLVLDIGLKRTPYDQIALRNGYELYPIHTAVLKSMLASVGGIGESQRRLVTVDVQQLDRFYVKHRAAIDFAVDLMWHCSPGTKGITIAPVMAPVARAFYSVNREKLIRFGEVVVTGMADRPGDSPAVVLRNYLIAGREKSLSSRTGRDRFTIYKKTEIALEAFIKGRSIERLGQRNIEVELFPMPNDIVIKLPKQEDTNGNGTAE